MVDLKPTRPSPAANTRGRVNGGPNEHGLYALGPLAFGASIGLQLMMVAFLRFGSTRGQPFARQLTPYGRAVSAPEYDLPIFVGGLALSLLACLAVAAWWVRAIERTPAAERAQGIRTSSLLLGFLGLASLIAALGLICSYWFSHDFLGAKLPVANPWKARDCYRLLLPAAMALSCALCDLWLGHTQAAKAFTARKDRSASVRAMPAAAFAIFLVLAIGVPPARWTDLAGGFFVGERCHHLNYFAVGPALSFAHGRAFGAEIYSQYGIGWPWLLAVLSPFFPTGSYGAFVGIEVVFGCLYSLGWFFALWLWFRSALWASIAVLLAVGWQLFTGMGATNVIWQFPSSTMLRHPFDVAFFAALILHQRSGRLAPIALAGLAAALGIFFETETGIYLLVAFALYWLLQLGSALRSGRPFAERTAALRALGAFYLTAVGVTLPLLLYTSRGTLFTRAFFSGWLEPLLQYGTWGIGALPMAIVPDATLAVFVAMIATYVAAIGYGVHRSLHGHARNDDVLLATICAYGLALLLLFTSRSHPFNLWHASVPFAIALTMLAHRGTQALRRRLPHSSIAHVLCVGLFALLLCNPNFLSYPSLLAAPFRDVPASRTSLMFDPRDLSGLSDDYQPFAASFQKIAAAIREVASGGDEVAVFDVDDTLLYDAAGVGPWSRYASLYTMAVSNRSLDELRFQLERRPPRFIVIRNNPAPPEYTFIWSPIHSIARSGYVLSQTVEDFEFWRRPDGSPAR